MKKWYINRNEKAIASIVPDAKKRDFMGGYTDAFSSVQYLEKLGLTLSEPIKPTTCYHNIASIALIDYIRTELLSMEAVDTTPARYNNIMAMLLFEFFMPELLLGISEVEGVPLLTCSNVKREHSSRVSSKLTGCPDVPHGSTVFSVANSRVLSAYGLGTLTAVIYHPTFDFDGLYSIRHDVDDVASVISELEVVYILSHDYNTPIPYKTIYNSRRQAYRVYIEAPDYKGCRDSILTEPNKKHLKLMSNYIASIVKDVKGE